MQQRFPTAFALPSYIFDCQQRISKIETSLLISRPVTVNFSSQRDLIFQATYHAPINANLDYIVSTGTFSIVETWKTIAEKTAIDPPRITTKVLSLRTFSDRPAQREANYSKRIRDLPSGFLAVSKKVSLFREKDLSQRQEVNTDRYKTTACYSIACRQALQLNKGNSLNRSLTPYDFYRVVTTYPTHECRNKCGASPNFIIAVRLPLTHAD